MNAVRRVTRLVCWLPLAALAVSMAPTAGRAADDSPPLALKRGFLRPLKFTVGEEEPRPVFGFSGLSFKPEFEDVMSAHPAAFDEVRKSLAWNGVALVGSAGLLAGALWLLADTVSDASDVSSGTMIDDSLNWGPVIAVAAGGAVMLTGALVSGSHINRGVAMYNDEELGRSRSPAGDSSGVLPIPGRSDGSVRIGFRVHASRDERSPEPRREREFTLSLAFRFS